MQTTAWSSELVHSTEQDTTYALSWVEKTIEGQNTRGAYQISDHFISAGSETLWVDHKLQVPDKDYRINYAAGEVMFTEPISKGAAIRARFRQIPISLDRVYRHREVVLADASGNVKPKATRQAPRGIARWDVEEPFGPLKVAGSKTFGITVGTDRDLSLEQALRLNISGQISKGVEVLAILSDQNIPIQPEGNTQTLRELDKVLMQVRGDHLSASLGDYELSLKDAEFAKYQRKLQGVLGEMSYPNAHLIIAGAVSEGEFNTMEIVPLEGNQGPYQLTARNGDRDIVVLAGTERVWINGERLVRGASNDYTIEYGNGQITFTARRLITSDLRIVVDYEYMNRKYRRSLAVGRSQGCLWNGKLRVGATLIREADDAQNPIDVVLSEQDKESIRQAGDDENAAWISGVRKAEVDSLGVGKGRYHLVYTDDGTPYYQADPSRQGPYDVSFSWVGQGNGDYVYTGGGIYQYVGPNGGEYMPYVLLPLPTGHHLASIDLGVDLSRTFKLSGEAALSHLDQNLSSPEDDHDNRGYAYKLSAHYQSDSWQVLGHNVGRLNISGRLRHVGDRFRAFERTQGVEDNRRWGIPITAERRGEQVREAELHYAPSTYSNIVLEYGQLQTGTTFKSTRRALRAALEGQKAREPTSPRGKFLPNVRYDREYIRAERSASPSHGPTLTSQEITRQRSNVDLMLWKLKPEGTYESEKATYNAAYTAEAKAAGAKSHTWSGGVSTMGLRDLALSYRYTMRKDEQLASTWHDSVVAHTQQCRLAWGRWKTFSLTGEYTHRNRREASFPAQNSSYDLAEINTHYAPFQGAFSGKIYYKVAHTQIAQKKNNYIEVGKGRGQYRWEDRNGDGQKDEEEFIPDWDGAYILYTESLGDLQPVFDMASSIRLQLEPWKLRPKSQDQHDINAQKRWFKILKVLSTDTIIDVEKKTRDKATLFDHNTFWYLEWLDDEGIMRGKRAITQDLHLFERQREGSLRFRYRESHTASKEFVAAAYKLVNRSRSVKARLRAFKKWHNEFSYEKGTKAKKGASSLAYNITLQRFKGRTSYTLLRPIRASVQLVWGRDRDQDPSESVSADLLSLKPELVYALKSQGRIRLQGDWSRVTTSPKDARLVYQMVDGHRAGDSFRWDVHFDHRLGRYVTALVSYTGRKEPGRQVTHSGRAEMRAYF